MRGLKDVRISKQNEGYFTILKTLLGCGDIIIKQHQMHNIVLCKKVVTSVKFYE